MEDLSSDEIEDIIDLADQLKKDKKRGKEIKN
jgi:ornithine carbamoyltransferase